ncbi:hypothetical protein HDV05_002333 [Chytridiales sp. JEL 0842]|nr:hypothetical protein HDV05_002333 [Chytridiales sp. JEL 0842]
MILNSPAPSNPTPKPSSTPLKSLKPPDVSLLRLQSRNRLKTAWERLFEKYSQDFTDEADEIDILTEEIVIDRGFLRDSPLKPFAAFNESLDSEEGLKEGLKEKFGDLAGVVEGENGMVVAEDGVVSGMDELGKRLKQTGVDQALDVDGAFKEETNSTGGSSSSKTLKGKSSVPVSQTPQRQQPQQFSQMDIDFLGEDVLLPISTPCNRKVSINATSIKTDSASTPPLKPKKSPLPLKERNELSTHHQSSTPSSSKAKPSNRPYQPESCETPSKSFTSYHSTHSTSRGPERGNMSIKAQHRISSRVKKARASYDVDGSSPLRREVLYDEVDDEEPKYRKSINNNMSDAYGIDRHHPHEYEYEEQERPASYFRYNPHPHYFDSPPQRLQHRLPPPQRYTPSTPNHHHHRRYGGYAIDPSTPSTSSRFRLQQQSLRQLSEPRHHQRRSAPYYIPGRYQHQGYRIGEESMGLWSPAHHQRVDPRTNFLAVEARRRFRAAAGVEEREEQYVEDDVDAEVWTGGRRSPEVYNDEQEEEEEEREDAFSNSIPSTTGAYTYRHREHQQQHRQPRRRMHSSPLRPSYSDMSLCESGGGKVQTAKRGGGRRGGWVYKDAVDVRRGGRRFREAEEDEGYDEDLVEGPDEVEEVEEDEEEVRDVEEEVEVEEEAEEEVEEGLYDDEEEEDGSLSGEQAAAVEDDEAEDAREESESHQAAVEVSSDREEDEDEEGEANVVDYDEEADEEEDEEEEIRKWKQLVQVVSDSEEEEEEERDNDDDNGGVEHHSEEGGREETEIGEDEDVEEDGEESSGEEGDGEDEDNDEEGDGEDEDNDEEGDGEEGYLVDDDGDEEVEEEVQEEYLDGEDSDA